MAKPSFAFRHTVVGRVREQVDNVLTRLIEKAGEWIGTNKGKTRKKERKDSKKSQESKKTLKGKKGKKDPKGDKKKSQKDKKAFDKGMSSGMRVLRQEGKTSDELIAKVRGEKRKYQFEMLQAKEVSETESKQTWSLTGRLGKHKRTQKLTRPKTLATQESHVSDKDRKLHKRVIEEVASKLLKLEKGDKNQADSFAKFYQLVTKKGKELAKTYQPKLRAGIKIEVKAIHSVAKDEKDGDVDMKIKIAPNTEESEVPVSHNNDEIKLPVKKGDSIKARYIDV